MRNGTNDDVSCDCGLANGFPAMVPCLTPIQKRHWRCWAIKQIKVPNTFLCFLLGSFPERISFQFRSFNSYSSAFLKKKTHYLIYNYNALKIHEHESIIMLVNKAESVICNLNQ